MKWVRIIPLAVLAAPLSMGADGSAGSRTNLDNLAPVLRNHDPETDIIVQLPGPAKAAPQSSAAVLETARVKAPAPMLPASSALPAALSPTASTAPATSPAPSDDPGRPTLRHLYPHSFEEDSAVFCQKLIGQWNVADAKFLLGEPMRQRPAFDDRQTVNGRIYAFADPTRRYRELELDFDASDGSLRTVFAYPWSLTWQGCRRIWGVQVSEADAPKGRRFYSYMDRRLDVLVDPAGKVISLGLY